MHRTSTQLSALSQKHGEPLPRVDHIDLDEPNAFERWRGRFDTVVCLNLLEHIKDPLRALRNIAQRCARGGRLVLYVPQHQRLYSSLDEVLGHHCAPGSRRWTLPKMAWACCGFSGVYAVDMYKQQDTVAEPVVRLAASGHWTSLARRTRRVSVACTGCSRKSIQEAKVVRITALCRMQTPDWYHGTDVVVFASTSENMPNILLEADGRRAVDCVLRSAPMPDVWQTVESVLIRSPSRP